MAAQKELFGRSDAAARPAKMTPRRFFELFSVFTVERLKACIMALDPKASMSGLKLPKEKLIDLMCSLAHFSSQADFDARFALLPPLLRALVEEAAFRRAVDVEPFEKRFAVGIFKEKNEFGFRNAVIIDPELRLGVFTLASNNRIALLDPFRELFSHYLPKPEGWQPAEIDPPLKGTWSAFDSIADSLGLAIKAIADMDRYELARKGLNMKANAAFELGCGISPFPIASSLGLHTGELVARFCGAFMSPDRGKSEDPETILRRMLHRFFDPSQRIDYIHDEMCAAFEARTLMDHLSKKSGTQTDLLVYPKVRDSFREGLSFAKGGWFRVDSLGRALAQRNRMLSIFPEELRGENLRLRADEIRLGKLVYKKEDWEDYIVPSGQLSYEVIGLPLIKAYCYLFAALGLLEIAETEPPQRLLRQRKLRPLSPYDGLVAIRLTPLGCWCLGFSDEKPAREAKRGLVLADPDLLLLTIEGKSLEKRVFLEQIGEKLGDDRYRVTEASFIAGCSSPEMVEGRIRLFGEIVSADPPDIWKRFFALARAKSAVFMKPEPALLYTLPDDPRIRDYFLNDPLIGRFAVKAEGGRLAVRISEYSKLAKVLESRGFICPKLKNRGKRGA